MTLAQAAPPRTLTVALAGNPNCGKTTLFNALTGLRQKVANYPGVTVEKKTGRCKLHGGEVVQVIDLPGAYSLISRSPDEVITMQVLRGLRPDTPAPDVVIAVLDASNLQRNLYLLSQLIELGRPLVVALNMVDIARRRGLSIAASRLSAKLGVPVVEVVAHKKQGIAELKRAITEAAVAPDPDFVMPVAMREEMAGLSDRVMAFWGAGSGSRMPGSENDTRSKLPEPGIQDPEPELGPVLPHEPRPMFVAERLLIGDNAPDLQKYHDDPGIGPALAAAHARLRDLGIDPMQADIEAHYQWIDHVAAASLEPACSALEEGSGFGVQGSSQKASLRHPATQTLDPEPRTLIPSTLDYAHAPTLTDRLDRVFLHRVWGTLTFMAIMAGLFVAIFLFAAPLMDAAEAAVGWLGERIAAFLPAEGPIKDLWTDGIVAGVGGVIVFVPQIAMLFLFLAVLEDSGYLARAAFLMDRLLGKLGLNGKSFIPLLSSHACAIPGIMAARTIENRQDRMATIFVAPFMSCSARLPVYGLLIGAFFASYSSWVKGGILFACYALGILAAVATAVLFRKTFLKGASNSFVLELPTYKVPQIGQILRVMWTNTWAFVSRAGTIIFALSVILWAMAYYPRLSPDGVANAKEQAVDRYNSQKQHWQGWTEGLKSNPTLEPPEPLQAGDDLESPRIIAGYSVREAISGGVALKRDVELTFVESTSFEEEAVAAAQLEQSISGRLGHLIEPVIR
ncbi:MAG TPA: ferrous iron transporter B, partial [Tepidisphaeraceae bacterium]